MEFVQDFVNPICITSKDNACIDVPLHSNQPNSVVVSEGGSMCAQIINSTLKEGAYRSVNKNIFQISTVRNASHAHKIVNNV